MENQDIEKLQTARHEAGHAVMARLLNIPVEYATIVGDAKNHGHVRFVKSKWASHWRIFNKCASPEEVLQRALVDAAGVAAELIFEGDAHGFDNIDYWDLWESQNWEGPVDTDLEKLHDLGIITDKQVYGTTHRAMQILRRKQVRTYLDQLTNMLRKSNTVQISEMDFIRPDKKLSDWTSFSKLAKKIFA